MSDNKHIPSFTATDIEKYHKGVLSNKERHALEKAAMDDPFLADALEGFAFAGSSQATDLEDLRNRLAAKTGQSKVVTMYSDSRRRSWAPLRAAVMILFLAGAALLVYQFGFKNKKQEVAQVDAKTASPVITDSSIQLRSGTIDTPADAFVNKTEKTTVNNLNSSAKTEDKSIPTADNNTATSLKDVKVTEEKDRFERDVALKKSTSPVTVAPGAEKNAEELKSKTDPSRKEVEMASDKQEDKDFYANRGYDTQNISRQNGNSRAPDGSNNAMRYQAPNVFRGRVTDADNNAVPFANVSNVHDNNTGTYTDVKGNFNLTSPDSVLTVQVRSVGYENKNVKLRNNVPTNQVVMADDRANLNEVIVSNQRSNNASRSRTDNRKLEQPEPADGWENYNAYLTNNLEVPADLREKRTTTSNQVEVSFDVDKEGNPTNITVEKSLCDKCDREAIRLVKEGPKWKRKAKKGRTTVTITF